MSERRALPWGLVLFACAGGPPAPTHGPSPRLVAVTSAKPERESPPAPSEAEPELLEVREATPAACRMVSDSWSFDRLRLQSGGKVFAKVRAAPVSVVLPVTEKATFATATLDDGEIIIRAIVEADDLELHPLPQTAQRAPTFLLGVVMPRAEASLGWVATTADRAKVSLDTGGVLIAPSPVIDEVPCEQLGLDTADFDARAIITKRTKLAKRWVARDGVELKRNLKAIPSAQLAEGVEVEVLEVRGAMTNILHDTPSFLVVGWVRSSELSTVPWGGLGHGGFGGNYGRGYPSFRGDTCAKDLPLVVEMGTERARVGTIRAGSSFRILDRPASDSRARRPKDERLRIELPRQPWFELDKSARFSVSAAELESCQARTP